MATLNSSQQFVADKMARMLIRESSDLDISTEDDLELDHENFVDVEKHSH